MDKYELEAMVADPFLDSFRPGGNPYDPGSGTAMLNREFTKLHRGTPLIDLELTNEETEMILAQRQNLRTRILKKINNAFK
jgi:hypothetical protein